MRLHSFIAFTCLAAIILTGCASFPQSADEFRSTTSGSYKFTVDQPLQSAYDLILNRVDACYAREKQSDSFVGGAGVNVSPPESTRVESSIDEAGGTAVVSTRYSVIMPGVHLGGLLHMIDLNRVDENVTQVVVYKLNNSGKWRRFSVAVESWFDGKDAC